MSQEIPEGMFRLYGNNPDDYVDVERGLLSKHPYFESLMSGKFKKQNSVDTSAHSLAVLELIKSQLIQRTHETIMPETFFPKNSNGRYDLESSANNFCSYLLCMNEFQLNPEKNLRSLMLLIKAIQPSKMSLIVAVEDLVNATDENVERRKQALNTLLQTYIDVSFIIQQSNAILSERTFPPELLEILEHKFRADFSLLLSLIQIPRVQVELSGDVLGAFDAIGEDYHDMTITQLLGISKSQPIYNGYDLNVCVYLGGIKRTLNISTNGINTLRALQDRVGEAIFQLTAKKPHSEDQRLIFAGRQLTEGEDFPRHLERVRYEGTIHCVFRLSGDINVFDGVFHGQFENAVVSLIGLSDKIHSFNNNFAGDPAEVVLATINDHIETINTAQLNDQQRIEADKIVSRMLEQVHFIRLFAVLAQNGILLGNIRKLIRYRTNYSQGPHVYLANFQAAQEIIQSVSNALELFDINPSDEEKAAIEFVRAQLEQLSGEIQWKMGQYTDEMKKIKVGDIVETVPTSYDRFDSEHEGGGLSKSDEEIKGYLMFDHNGVIDEPRVLPSHWGNVPEYLKPFQKQYQKNSDLYLRKGDVGGNIQVMPNGKIILPLLYELDLNGYKTVYMSGNIETDQVTIKSKIEKYAGESGIPYPPVYAMAVKDKRTDSEFLGYSQDQPKVIRDREHGVIVAGTDDDSTNGKTFLRAALKAALGITEQQKQNSIVFDDGFPNVRNAQEEGYQAFRVGGEIKENENGKGAAVQGGELLNGVQAFYHQAKRAVEASGGTWITEATAPRSEEPVESESSSSASASHHTVDSVEEFEGHTEGAFGDWLTKTNQQILGYMQWTAHPRVRPNDIEKAKEYLRTLNFCDGLIPPDPDHNHNNDIRRTLFNLAVYSFKTGSNAKAVAIRDFLAGINDAEDLSQYINDALNNNDLVKNTKVGFYKFFHSGPLHIENPYQNNRWARSTTEELLINLDKAFKDAGLIHQPQEDDELSP